MDKLRKFFLLTAMIGFITACSSEEEIIEPKPETNGIWQEVNFSLGVLEGTPVNSRAIGDLDANGVPKAEYPQELGLYMQKYAYMSNKGEFDEKVVKLYDENTESKAATFSYYIDTNNNEVTIKGNSTDSDEASFKIKIRESVKDVWEGDFFMFTSQKEAGPIQMPRLDPEQNLYKDEYPDATMEYGDRLFVSCGYFFAWKDKNEGVVGLYYYVHNDYEGHEKDEIREVEQWQTKTLDIYMDRKTACLSVRLMIVDSFDNGNWKNIAGLEDGADGETAIKYTNEALNKYLEDNNEPYKFEVQDLFIRKKVLTEFPSVYTLDDGFDTRYGDRLPMFVCNLDYPAWMKESADFQNGNVSLHGLTSICDSEPFIPADEKNLSGISLHLFMGFGNAEKEEYDKAVVMKVDFDNGYAVSANTVTRMYILFTLKNVVEFYKYFTNSTPSTRSVEEFTLSPEQVVFASEPYRSDKK